MVRFLLLLFLLLSAISLVGQFNIELIANVDYTENRGRGNDIWGYVAPDGAEYAVVGTVDGTLIYSLENHSNPVERIFIPGTNSVWRDMKHFGEYIYVTADAGGDGLLIIDMRNAPEDIQYIYRQPEITTASGDSYIIQDCHNIHIDENGIIYLAGCGSRGTDIFDPTSDPWNPPHIGAIESPYHHDNYIKGDTLYGSQIYSGEIAMYDISDKGNPLLLGTAETSSNFTHNAWADPSHRYVFTTDERSEGDVDSYDIRDPENIERLDQFKPPGSSGTGTVPHNTHYFNEYLVTSWYTEGVVITDVSQPENMVMVGQYDTYNGPDGGFSGCWGTTPFLPSGYILANDRNTGLYVLKADYKKASRLAGLAIDTFSGVPLQNVDVRIVNGDYEDNDLTNPKGEFQTGQVTAGTFLVEFYHPSYDEKTIEVNLVTGETTRADVQLVPSKKLDSYFKVIDKHTRAPVPFALINIHNNGNEYEIQTDARGLADTSVFNGVYNIYLGKWGYLNREITSFSITEENQYILELESGYMDDFALDLGWSVEIDTEAEEFKGAWELDVPIGTGGGKKYNVDFDVSSDISDMCYITGNSKWSTFGSHVVNDGSTSLISPPMDLSNYVNPSLEFALWMTVPVVSEKNNTIEVFLNNDEKEELIYSHEIGDNLSAWSSPINLLIDQDQWNLEKELFVKIVVNDDGSEQQLVEAAFDQFIVRGELRQQTPLKEGTLTVFPNPSDNALRITYDLANIESVEILDMTGRFISSHAIGFNFAAVISTEFLINGTYIAKVNLADNSFVYAKFQVIH